MEDKNLNKLLDSFNCQAGTTKTGLANLLAKVSDGRVPDKDEIESVNSDMDKLIAKYEQLKREAENILTPDEFPETGCRAVDYVDAVAQSRSRMIRLKLEKAEAILQEFLKVKSQIIAYEAAISPFRNKASALLKELSGENIERILPETKGPEFFLKALEIENITTSPEGMNILDEISKHYPKEVQWGLIGRNYFIDKNVNENTETESRIQLTETESSKSEAGIKVVQNKGTDSSSVPDSSGTDKVQEINKSEDEVKEKESDESSDIVENEENGTTRDEAEVFTAINKVKTGSPSASSFKKEIIKLSKVVKEVRPILPLLTNLGILSREQIYLFGICMDCFEESDSDREKVNAAIDSLKNKGYLACFEYDTQEGRTELFCLSSYCYNCLKKDSISVQMHGFWGLSFGDTKIASSAEIDKNIAEKFFKNNEKLAEYLYGAKDSVEQEDYQRIQASLKWTGDYYRVAVAKGGEITNCYLLESENVPGDITEDGILAVCPDNKIIDALSKCAKKVFVYSNHSISILGKDEDKNINCKEVKNLPHEVKQSTDKPSIKAEAESENHGSAQKAGNEQPVEKQIPEEEMGINNNSEISVESLLGKRTLPRDDEFCEVIGKLLNREAATKTDLTSIISQTAVFARAVGDVSEKKDGNPVNYIESYRLSAQIRLASHLMLKECVYTSKFLSSAFTDPSKADPAVLLSAYLFAMLVPGMAYDFALKDQIDLFFAQYEDYFSGFPAFKPLFNKLREVRGVSESGFSSAAVSSLGDEAEKEKFISGLRESARERLILKAPKTRLKALPRMYSDCFGRESELYECMELISQNNQSDVGYVEEVLAAFCDDQNGTLNISESKIEDAINEAWGKLNSRSSFKLEYDARDQAIREFQVRLDIMLNWVEHIHSMNKDISKLKTLRNEILKLIREIAKDSTWKNQKSANILSWNLYYMQHYLNGEVPNLGIYTEYIYKGILAVDDDGIPVIDSNLTHVKYYEPWRNVLKHIVTPRKSFEDVKAEILGSNLDDEADETGLKDNLHQLLMLGRLLGKNGEDYTISENQLKDATDSADDRTTRFKEKLELAYTYNQINETEKENLLGLIIQFKSSFYGARDFACWRRFLEALENQITEFAIGRKKQLRARLDTRLKENPKSSLLNAADHLLEKEMNLAVAEEYINRFENGETELADDVILHDSDYFSDFLRQDTFDPLWNECNKNKGRALSSFGWNYISRHKPSGWTSRQEDDSRNLVTSWPKRKGATKSTQIKTLLSGLGFDVVNVDQSIVNKEEVFEAEVRKTAKSMPDYTHPIAAFGTQIKSPLDVVVFYGNHTPRELVDKVSNMNLGGISIVLLDRPVTQAERRTIGEIFHTQTSGQNPFLLIDQVLLLYLAMHQITERMPAMLKCTLPYSTYQPFVRDGGSTSDEMFCGRTMELNTIIDPNGACVVYGGRQLGKTALLERAESRCSKPEYREFAVYTTIVRVKSEKEATETIVNDINKKVDGKFELPKCSTIKEMCTAIGKLFHNNRISSMLLLIDEVDDFLVSIADQAYRPIQALVDLKRETKNNFKFVIAGLHNVCRAKNATRNNGVFGQLGTPLCIKPLSPTDALNLISRPLRYLGFQIDRYPHLETILTNTNYYPGILQFFGYMLVQTLTGQYSKYYHAADGNPPFTLQDEQLGAVMNSSDLNKSIKDKFRWSLELDPRYFMIARCITLLYHYNEDIRRLEGWYGFSVDEIINVAKDYNIHCLENESRKDYINLMDEMVEMGILGKPDENRDLYRLRRNSFVDIIGENVDAVDQDITVNNEED